MGVERVFDPIRCAWAAPSSRAIRTWAPPGKPPETRKRLRSPTGRREGEGAVRPLGW